LTYKYTNYYNRLIETFDNFLPEYKYTELYNQIIKLPYYYGESDGPDAAPSGLITDLNNNKIHDYLYQQVKDLDSIKDLVHERTYVNYFASGEDATYHNDDTARTILFYFSTFWDLNEGGETKFSIDAKNVLGLDFTNGAENYPVIISIAPIPNRMVIFRGDLIHTASSFKNRGRFTLAMKFKESK
jgi:hypothetical protein